MSEFVTMATAEQLDRIDDLLRTSTISAENNEYWCKRLNTLEYHNAEHLIEYLEKKQVNRVHAGLNYNMGYLNWFLKKSV